MNYSCSGCGAVVRPVNKSRVYDCTKCNKIYCEICYQNPTKHKCGSKVFQSGVVRVGGREVG